ncbi:MAG: gene transfer agent family protein [Sulfitobacter sp.]
MANPWQGEVALVINEQRYAARLSLGALAELEEALGAGSLMALVARFEGGAFTSRDVLAVLAAGLRGGGSDLSAAALADARIEGGPMAAAKAAAQLLARAFVVPQ